jgi:hypothetical protein
MKIMLKKLALWCCIVFGVLFSPSVSSARPPTPEKDVLDARLEGYDKPVTIEGQNSALTWILLIFLTIIGVGGMFKNAKRTHLD